MAKKVAEDWFVSVDGVDFSSQVKSVNVPRGRDEKEITAMGDTTHLNKGGLKTGSFSVEFFMDYASSGVDEKIAALYDAGTEFVIICRPVTGAVSATNPNYTATVFISDAPIAAAIGDEETITVNFSLAGNLTRATS